MSRALYIILLAGAALFYPLYSDKLSFIILMALIILPFIMLAQLMISSAFLRIKAQKTHITVYKDESGELLLGLTNDSVFPLPNTKIRVKAVFSPGGIVKYSTVNVPLPALRTETVALNFGAEHCGKADITVEYVKIYDLLRLFSIKRFKKKIKGCIYVIPKVSDRYADEARALMDIAAKESAEEAQKENKTGIPGDVSGFREFMPGDRISLMHYKLSARFDKDIVKILGSDGGHRFLLRADLSAQSLEKRDFSFERLMSMAYYLRSENAQVFAEVPADSDCGESFGSGIRAARFESEQDYFTIARALSGEAPYFIPDGGINDFICVDISQY